MRMKQWNINQKRLLPSLILCLIKDDGSTGKTGETTWNRNEQESAKSLQAIWYWQVSTGAVYQFLFVLPIGNLSGLFLNIFHKLNVTFSFSSSHQIFSESEVSPGLFPKMETVKLIILRINHVNYLFCHQDGSHWTQC